MQKTVKLVNKNGKKIFKKKPKKRQIKRKSQIKKKHIVQE